MKNIKIGVFSFILVLLFMPLGHTLMILNERLLTNHKLIGAGIIGFIGVCLLVLGISKDRKKSTATLFGLLAGILVWTGWIEFSFVWVAEKLHIEALTINGEVVTKPEYLLLPSSIGFWAVFMIQYFFGSKTGCTFFNWFRKKLSIDTLYEFKASKRNIAVSTFMETIILLWTFYLVLLFAYDENFAGERHIITYVIAYGSLFWSFYLSFKLLRIKTMDYAIKYAIPTVIIFWNFVEVMGRWNFFDEFWIEPGKYWLELSLIFFIFILLVIVGLFGKKISKTPSIIK